ncbi:IclR family transcriptional regulator [Glaciihabitans sp. INWT7]|uniref:IclR family transcriptional regulator n=1 Tax=Glaciihabitans sp. INWT7 TaxID=2596912 RepID=UPI001860D91F|nr:IclR family transcriptional regulator [Glaciihabitans sp. INWT7]QNE46662.1 IclR family transcriptional regulator [Glaciihabitans sp. INWT7]
MDDHPTGSAPAAHHTLRILALLSAQRGPVAASTISHALGLPRSTVYRLLGVLENHGFVIHFPEERRYGIGIAAFELSSGFMRQEPLTRLGRPILSALVDRLGESAHLAVLHGRDVVYLIEERAPGRPHLVTDVGVRLPSHVTASGRALLATLPKSQLRALFPSSESFVHHSDAGPSTYSQLSRLLDGVRERGYAAEDGDVTEGIASVAVAVRDHAGWPAAGIAVSFPRPAIPPERWPELADQIGAVAAELSRRISGQASPR